MKYRMLTVLTAGICLLTGCSASGTESSEPQETIIVYQALPLPQIYLDIPESFEVTSSQFYEEYYIQDDASIIVTEDTNGPFTSVYNYAVSALNQYQSVAHTLDVISWELIEAKNCRVQLLEFNYTLGEDDAVKLSSLAGFASDGQSMYIITCKSDASTYDSHKKEFLTVMESVMLFQIGA